MLYAFKLSLVDYCYYMQCLASNSTSLIRKNNNKNNSEIQMNVKWDVKIGCYYEEAYISYLFNIRQQPLILLISYIS